MKNKLTKNQQKNNFYNSIYSRDKNNFYWGLEPHELVVKSSENFPVNTKVLDLGCGEGKDSFYLAEKRFDVTAVDNSDVGIVKLDNFAKEKGLKIKTIVSDLEFF